MMSRKVRVLLLVRWPVGGIRTFIRYVYRNFDPEIYAFCVVGPDHAEMDVLEKDLSGLPFEFKRLSPNPSAVEILFVTAKLLFKGGFDLIHSQGFTSALCAALPAAVTRTPHLLTSHDVFTPKQFQGLKGKCRRSIMAVVFKLLDVIHCVSNDALENLLDTFPFLKSKSSKCVVIANGIEASRFKMLQESGLRQELGVGSDVFLIGFLGRFMAQKGFVYLVEAIERLLSDKDLTSIPMVVSFGGGGFVREEKDALTRKGLQEHFRFLPFVPNVAETINALDVVVMPSLWEACPLLPMETLAVGTPLIATDCVGLREVVKGTPTYVVPVKDSAMIAKGIKHFMISDNRESFVKFRERALARFDVKHQFEAIEALYAKVLNGDV
ncbi:glycosyltransferase family 4 protein [Geomonas oryzae]|uniref:glycosyltransferase family 4 protein n=1 Tax=Geomonas oryzae TaxID=2364273 RepID=UPI00100BD9F4|nr:glycosyltransferase family 4 protein [Geomonas oryzae]